MKFLKTFLASTLGAIIGGGLLLLLIFFIFGAILTPKGPQLEVKDKAFLKVTLSNGISERSDQNPFRSTGLGLPDVGTKDGLYEIRQGLEKAAEDEKIAGIYLKMRGMEAGWATVAAIRDALVEFKKSGKPIYAWSDRWSEKSLHLAGVADHLYMHPVGGFDLNGFASTPMFYKKMFDKVGIEPKIFKVGTFKSAVEPFKDYEMSEANREQVTTLLFDFWDEFRDSLAQVREGVTANSIDTLATYSELINRPQQVVKEGLLDDVLYEHEVHAAMKEAIGKESEDDLEVVSLSKYVNVRYKYVAPNKSAPKVAVIFMEGTIVDGKGGNGEIGGDRFVSELRRVRKDENVKAVVLRINSPGGSAIASDLMWAEIEALKEKKPVIASMGDVAASGGYYISAPCNYVFARPTTVTGSIGVFSLMLNTEELMEENIGLTYDRVATHPMADLGNPNREMGEDEEAVMQEGVNRIYSRFIEVVRSGRGFEDSVSVDKIAQGRVWSGKRAMDLGLVDEMGGLDAAIAYAKEQIDSEEDKDKIKLMLLPEPTDPFEKLAESLSQMKIDIDVLAPELKEKVEEYRAITRLKSGHYMMMPMELDIN